MHGKRGVEAVMGTRCGRAGDAHLNRIGKWGSNSMRTGAGIWQWVHRGDMAGRVAAVERAPGATRSASFPISPPERDAPHRD